MVAKHRHTYALRLKAIDGIIIIVILVPKTTFFPIHVITFSIIASEITATIVIRSATSNILVLKTSTTH